jgi:ribulose bisphosphate carboxylase small subunit
MKIQINNLEALERLIGGDTELEIEIRNSVVQDFAKKHLKSVAKELLDQGFTISVKKLIQDEFFRVNSWGEILAFNEKTHRKLAEELNNDIRKTFDEILMEVLEFNKLKQTVQERLNKTLDYIDAELKSKVLEQRLDQMVDKRLKEKLGINV